MAGPMAIPAMLLAAGDAAAEGGAVTVGVGGPADDADALWHGVPLMVLVEVDREDGRPARRFAFTPAEARRAATTLDRSEAEIPGNPVADALRPMAADLREAADEAEAEQRRMEGRYDA